MWKPLTQVGLAAIGTLALTACADATEPTGIGSLTASEAASSSEAAPPVEPVDDAAPSAGGVASALGEPSPTIAPVAGSAPSPAPSSSTTPPTPTTPTTSPAPTTAPAPPSTAGSTEDAPRAHEVLAEALARSTEAGRSELDALFHRRAEARCVADGAVADIGLDRYAAAYGVDVGSLATGPTMFEVTYDRIDAEAMVASLDDCIGIETVLRRVMDDSGIDADRQTCIVTRGLDVFENLLLGELMGDTHLLDESADSMNQISDECGEGP